MPRFPCKFHRSTTVPYATEKSRITLTDENNRRYCDTPRGAPPICQGCPLKLRLSPLQHLSVQVLLRPPMDRSPTAASATGPLRTLLLPLVGCEFQCPPVPGFPAASSSEPCAFGLLFPAFLLPQLACVASAPHAFHISRKHSAYAQTNQPKLWSRCALAATPQQPLEESAQILIPLFI
ncbi:hypothetical protein PGTUg99_002663 [Puccinia graminis f. sp. tritici]|uniref:Uncharacterized protein n=1 Tax=Puccinia graminis f. sp. tritici TaxID=56615 RepID=A0A5B0P939_PUCGR|nr:hypothetical protein PGTUg99_002663 [Puccinia graminis f. sp. tritici]